MSAGKRFVDFVAKEWLLAASAVGMILVSALTRHWPVFTFEEIEVLFILFALFVAVNGLRASGLLFRVARLLEHGRLIPLKLVVTTFFLSMLVTNDVSLIVMVPLTLSLDIDSKGLLVISEALAANAGSALTPIGNPQNLYIYWFYGLKPFEFVRVIAPFSLSFLLVVLIVFWIYGSPVKTEGPVREHRAVGKQAWFYAATLVMVALTVVRVLPIYVNIGFLVLIFLWDRKILCVDYPLLASFFFLFGLSNNAGSLIHYSGKEGPHVFLVSALLSQVLSNVPVTLLLAKMTVNWKPLLWGVNVGGFGSLIGSFANLIAYRMYIIGRPRREVLSFTVYFLGVGYLVFLLYLGFYFVGSQIGWFVSP